MLFPLYCIIVKSAYLHTFVDSFFTIYFAGKAAPEQYEPLSDDGDEQALEEEEEEEDDGSQQDDDGSQQGDRPDTKEKVRRAKRAAVKLPEATQIKALQLIQENPILWDKTAKDFNKSDQKEAKWREICEEVGVSYQDLVTQWWRSFRSEFGKISWEVAKRPSGSGADSKEDFLKKLTHTKRFVLEKGTFLEGAIYRQPGRTAGGVSK